MIVHHLACTFSRALITLLCHLGSEKELSSFPIEYELLGALPPLVCLAPECLSLNSYWVKALEVNIQQVAFQNSLGTMPEFMRDVFLEVTKNFSGDKGKTRREA